MKAGVNRSVLSAVTGSKTDSIGKVIFENNKVGQRIVPCSIPALIIKDVEECAFKTIFITGFFNKDSTKSNIQRENP